MMPAVLTVARREGHAVVLDAYGLPYTAADLTTAIRILEQQQQAAPPEYRRWWAGALAWRRAILTALEAAEANDAQSCE